MKPAPRLAALFAAAVLTPAAARAWSANGHKTVALIAESRLSDAAKSAVAAILGPNATLDAIAPCADDIRGKTGFNCAGISLSPEPQSESWHFVDVPITASPADGAALESFCAGGACVVNQISSAAATLKDPGTSVAAKQVALMFLVHFVGDEHQPLHCANEIVNGVNDRGGNLKPVVFEGAAINLHSLWDHQIEPTDDLDPATRASALGGALAGRDLSAWTSGDFVADAALESFAIAKGTAYPAYYASDPKSLGADYQARMRPIVDERLQRAGVRLAALLESSLVGGAAPIAPAPPAVAPPPGENPSSPAELKRAALRIRRASDAAPPP